MRHVDCAEDTVEHVVDIARATNASAVLWSKRYKPRACALDSVVRKALSDIGVLAHDFLSETLMEPSHTKCGIFDDFQSYTRFWTHALRRSPPTRPKSPIRPEQVRTLSREQLEHTLAVNLPSMIAKGHCLTPSSASIPLPDVDHLNLLEGLSVDGDDAPGDVGTIGCIAAERSLNAFLIEKRLNRFSLDAARRDGMVTGDDLATSRLSPHIRFGEISPRVLFYAVVDAGARAKWAGNLIGLESARIFLKNMSLREFGYYVLVRYPFAACKPIMPEFEVFPWVSDDQGVQMHAWQTGTTGFPIVDAAMRQLFKEGWIHNRMRFLAASFFCKYLLLPWPLGAAHLVRTLVDGDEACNSLGWQWTVGCNSDSFPFSTLVNPLSLQNHSQSTRVAAAYVRRYVPELAALPDSLIFTPWKASAEEMKIYNLNVVPHPRYNDLRDSLSPTRTINGTGLRIYPARIVNGPDARVRARNAMEVMRRIFAAQRQCRTIIVDQSFTNEGRSLYEEVQMGRQRPALLEGSDEPLLDHMSLVTGDETAAGVERKKEGRARDLTSDAPLQSPLKRQRVRSPNITKDGRCNQGSMSLDYLSNSSEITSGEVDLLLSSSVTPAPQGQKKPRTKVRNRTSVAIGQSGSTGSTIPECTAKRPRSSLSRDGRSSDERLSVKSLLTPELHPPPNMESKPVPTQQYHQLWGAQVGGDTDPNKSSKLSEAPSMQTAPVHKSANGEKTVHARQVFNSTSPSLNKLSPNSHPHLHDSRKSLEADHSLASPPLAYSAVKASYPESQKHSYPRGQSIPFSNVPPISQLHQARPDQLQQQANHSRATPFTPRVNMVSGSQVPVVGLHHPSQKGLMVPQAPFDSSRMVNSGLYHPNVATVPLVQDHFAPHGHNAQVLVPFRNHNVHAMGPQAGAVPAPDGSQRYFEMPPVNAHPGAPRAAPGQPIVWYPAMTPYVDLRMPRGMPGSHMLHQLVPQPSGHLPVGYTSVAGGNPGPGSARGAGTHPDTSQGALIDPNSSNKPGPSTPAEREAIARRMAAMDYYDEAYGGKHWEQWQAIAIHLLDQYMFSEDTDRETSKAYVRLCVLKDELRDANPNGPRVTVNHCKEVFRILRLPVTGEWDRRGHGGVRGPYCYGCVKRSGVQISKK